LFKKGISIDNKYFIVEILRRNEDVKIIMYDPTALETFSLTLTFTEILDIMGGKEDYEALVSLFKIQNDEITLVKTS
jgi:hypothetical protein